MRRLSVFLALLAVGLGSSVRGDDAAERATLKGIGAVHLQFSERSPEVQKRTFKSADLQSQVEQRLKAGGVSLLAPNEHARGTPTLYLGLTVLPDVPEAGFFAYSVDLTLSQEVRLVRAPNVRAMSATWKAGGAVGVIDEAMVGTLRDTALEAVDAFVKAYREANGLK